MIPGFFEYYAPRSLTDVVNYLIAHKDDVKILSGGQSLLPLMKMRLSKPGYVVDIGRIPGLDTITEEGDNLIIGALVTHEQIESSDLLKAKCPLLPQTATTIADVQVRNRGTLGGSIAHADPAGDMPAAILALDAGIKVAGEWRTVDRVPRFFLGPNGVLSLTKSSPRPCSRNGRRQNGLSKSGAEIVGFAVAGPPRVDLNAGGTCNRGAIAITGVSIRPIARRALSNCHRQETGSQNIADAALSDAHIDVIEDINGSRNTAPISHMSMWPGRSAALRT
jgi:carbon-monoxide dehydrogenase medium subunit